MKQTLFKLLSLTLACLLLLPMAVSCAQPGESETTTTLAPEATTAPEAETTLPVQEETTPTAQSVLGDRDFGDATVTFYSRYYNGIWRSDLMADDDASDTLSVAVSRRNKQIEQTYNVKLAEIQSGSATFKSALEKLVTSNDESFDAVYMSMTDAANSAQAGLLIDLHELDNIDLEAEWWSQTCNKSWSIAHRQFFAVGDITTIDNMSARGVFVNKDILNENQLESPYTCVENNTWTIEKMFELANAAYIPDGNGVDTLRYGISAQNSFGFIMLMAAGEMISKNDEDDIPQISIGNERSIAVVDKLATLTGGNKGVFLGADADVMAHFTNNEALFMPEVLYHIITLRDASFEVGVLPAPKYDSDQESYYSFTTGYGITCLGFPQSCYGDRLDRASFIVEAMSIQSLTTLTPAYFEVCVKTRYAPDLESSGMIQIILDTIYTDLAEVYAWGGLRDKVQSTVTNGGSITSTISSSKKLAVNAAKRTVEAWQNVKSIK